MDRELIILYIVFNSLHTINYMWLKSLSMPRLNSLSIVINTLHTIKYMCLKSLSMSQLRSPSMPMSLSMPWLRSLSMPMSLSGQIRNVMMWQGY